MADKLTNKQVRFCQEYTIDFNATQAAIRAGYSEDTAGAIGHENLKKPQIEAYVNEIIEEAANALKITRERILNELARIAFSDIRKYYDEEGRFKNIHDIDSDSAAALSSIESDETFEWVDGIKQHIGQAKKVKIHNKINALENLSAILGHNAPIKTEGNLIVNWHEQLTDDIEPKTEQSSSLS